MTWLMEIVKFYLKEKFQMKKLCDKAFNTAKVQNMMDTKHEHVFSGHKFIDKRASSRAVNIARNKELAKELPKSIIKKLEKRKVHSSFIDNIWGAYFADLKLLCKFNKGICFLLCVINIFSKYVWVVALKDKKSITIINAYQKLLKESGRKTNKIWADKGR